MTPWEWKIFSDKERYDMYTTSQNLIKQSNEQIAKYEEESNATQKKIEDQTKRLEDTKKELAVLKAGKDHEAMKVMVSH
jgi:predicted S18 family serine protease